MSHFANSVDADTFKANWCARCRNWRDRDGEDYDPEGDGCPVMDLHFTHGHAERDKWWLSQLIADTSPPGERRCHLFVRGVKP